MPAGRIYTATTPFNDVELFDFNKAQSNDVLYMAHWDHAPGKLQRYAHDDWRWADVTFGPDITAPTGLAVTVNDPVHDGGSWNPTMHRYKVAAISEDSNQESLPSAYVEAADNDLSYPENTNDLEWDAVAGAKSYVLYRAVNGIYGYIGGTTELEFTDDNIAPDLSITPQEQRNPFEDDGDDHGNRPGEVFLYEQRLGYARTRNNPNAVWLSQAANYENMNVSTPQTARDAISFKIVGRPGNFIQSMVPSKSLIVLTVGSTYLIETGQADYLTPTNIRPRPGPSRGSSKVEALTIDEMIFHIQARGNRPRTLGFTYETDGYRGDDLSVYARHLFKNRVVVDWCYTEEPNPAFWIIFDDGEMVCLSWIREQALVGMTRIETDGFFESCCVVPEEGEDKLYVLVRRTIGEEDKRFIERMATTEWEDITEAIYLDSSMSTYEPGSGTVRGLHHLEGMTVAAVIDGKVVLDLIVEDGVCEIGYAWETSCHVGLVYEQLVETLPIPGNMPGVGSVQGRTQTTTGAIIKVIETKGIEAGAGGDGDVRYYEPKVRTAEAYGDPTALYTGDLEVDGEVNWSEGNATVFIRQTLPLPMTLAGVFPDHTITS